MHRFFVEPSQIGEKRKFVITGPDVNHIRNVLRMRAEGGGELLAADGQGRRIPLYFKRASGQ